MASPKPKSRTRKSRPATPDAAPLKAASTLFELAQGAPPPTDAEAKEQDAPHREREARKHGLEMADTFLERMKFLSVENKLAVAQHLANGINSLTKMFHVVVFQQNKPEPEHADFFKKPPMEVSLL